MSDKPLQQLGFTNIDVWVLEGKAARINREIKRLNKQASRAKEIQGLKILPLSSLRTLRNAKRLNH